MKKRSIPRNSPYSRTFAYSEVAQARKPFFTFQPDWLLIYRIEAAFLVLERTGTHVDLFD
ncbi:MAG: type II toxin-antitoxin system YafQ family toxin [Nitrospirota bacterium]